jgi:hypothetical protein
MLNRNIITPKKDLEKGSVHVKNRFTYYPLYDTEKNSYIKRYRLWAKYRDKCIKDGRKYVSCKDYAKILKKIGDRIEDTLLEDPNGVNFGHFTLKQSFKKTGTLTPKIDLVNNSKKSGGLKYNSWAFRVTDSYTDRLNKLIKDKKINEFDYNILEFKKIRRDFEKKLDIFNDF